MSDKDTKAHSDSDNSEPEVKTYPMNNITPAELVRYFTGSDENDSEEDQEEAYVQKLRSSYESDR